MTRRHTPLSPREVVITTLAIFFGVVAALLNADQFAFGGKLLSQKDDRPPVHTVLPNLCESFPSEQVALVIPAPRIDGYKVDRNEITCTWRSTQRDTRAFLSINAHRPHAGHVGDIEDARSELSSILESRARDGGTVQPVGGIGDEAGVATKADKDEANLVNTELHARDGLLLIELRLSTYLTHKEKAGVTAERDSAAIKQLATALLRILPPKGR